MFECLAASDNKRNKLSEDEDLRTPSACNGFKKYN